MNRAHSDYAPVSCPHCTSVQGWRARTCCVCQETRQIARYVAEQAVANVWARIGCDCDTCRVLAKMPGAPKAIVQAPAPVLVSTPPAVTLHAPAVTMPMPTAPYESFRESFARRAS